MQNTSYVSLSHQSALWRQMDMIANNLANVNTPAYKAEGALFTDYLVRSKTSDSPFDVRVAFVQDFGTIRDYAPGPMQATGNPLDMALDGEGFFVVFTDDGPRYTRNGHFRLDEEGQLVNTQGLAVLSEDGEPFFLAPNETTLDIARDGTVSTENGEIGRLQIVRFDEPQALRKTHSGLYEAAEQQPEPVEERIVVQGMLEQSNVNPIVEITRMIEVQRAYEASNRMIQQEDDRQRKAIETILQTSA